MSSEPTWVVHPPELVASTFTRVVNVRRGGDCDVYIGRAGRGRRDSGWGNPFRMESNSLRARLLAVTSFAAYVASRPEMIARTGTLSGLLLGCWCSPSPCHGHVLAGLANLAPWEHAMVFDWTRELADASAALPYRLLVTGSRTWTDRTLIAEALNHQHRAWNRPTDAVLVVGDATGADAIAAELWEKAGLPVERHVADWDTHGERAGMIRNAAMVASGVDACLAFSRENSPGTRHCSTAASRAGVPTIVVAHG